MKLDNMQIANMLETATVAARLAGQKAMELVSYTKTIHKSPTELVTGADPICQEIIINRIKETFPDHGFIAEEGNDGKIFKQTPRGEPFWWVIDPIDGTNNYAHKLFDFCVSIAVMAEGKPVAGVIYQPACDLMFTGAIGMEAQLNNSRIKCSDEPINIFASVAIDSLFADGVPLWMNNIMTKVRFRNLGTTALHLAYTASGGLIGAITSSPRLWDIAAGMIILERAGAILTNWKGEKFESFNLDKYEGEKFDILAASAKTHQDLVKIINQ